MAVAAAEVGKPGYSRHTIPPIFDVSVAEFTDRFNRLPFGLSHGLGEHPLFKIPRLVELAGLLWSKGGGRVTFQSGDVQEDIRWDQAPRKRMSVVEALRNIETSGSWVLLKGAQEDPEYRTLMETCFDEVERLSGRRLRNDISWMDSYIFIASPNSVTPHHIDHECNFLLQIHGEKDISICDPRDRSMLTDEEIESYYLGDLSAAKMKPDSHRKATVYHLSPGKGVHLPVRAPHWVKNGNTYSVSYSIHFFLHSEDRKARVYQVNHYLREMNLKPVAPGNSVVRDEIKARALGMLATGHNHESKAELLRGGMGRLDSVARHCKKLFGARNS